MRPVSGSEVSSSDLGIMIEWCWSWFLNSACFARRLKTFSSLVSSFFVFRYAYLEFLGTFLVYFCAAIALFRLFCLFYTSRKLLSFINDSYLGLLIFDTSSPGKLPCILCSW